MKIAIDVNEYIRLKKVDATMDLLEGAGVDNWSGYGYALNPEDEDYDDIMQGIENGIIEEFAKK